MNIAEALDGRGLSRPTDARTAARHAGLDDFGTQPAKGRLRRADDDFDNQLQASLAGSREREEEHTNVGEATLRPAEHRDAAEPTEQRPLEKTPQSGDQATDASAASPAAAPADPPVEADVPTPETAAAGTQEPKARAQVTAAITIDFSTSIDATAIPASAAVQPAEASEPQALADAAPAAPVNNLPELSPGPAGPQTDITARSRTVAESPPVTEAAVPPNGVDPDFDSAHVHSHTPVSSVHAESSPAAHGISVAVRTDSTAAPPDRSVHSPNTAIAGFETSPSAGDASLEHSSEEPRDGANPSSERVELREVIRAGSIADETHHSFATEMRTAITPAGATPAGATTITGETNLEATHAETFRMLADRPAADTSERIVQSLRLQFQRGGGDAIIHIKPEHLGPLTISVRVDNGTVAARVIADNPLVVEWLQANEHTLREGLKASGLQLDRLVVHRDPDPSGRTPQREFAQSRREPRRPLTDRQSTFEITV